MRTRRLRHIAFLFLLCGVTPLAADTPEWVNYQGVLRDAAGAPRSGPVEMTFWFYDAPVGGNEILVDEHLSLGTGAVVVASGLFTVPLGSGNVHDGSAVLPGDPYVTLSDMFRDFPDVWMEIGIGPSGSMETLEPRVPVRAVPYAHQAANADLAVFAADAARADKAIDADFAITANSATTAASAATATNATQLGGVPASGYLNTSATAQTKSGNLTVNGTLLAGGNVLGFASPGAKLTATDTFLTVDGGDQGTDDLLLRANGTAAQSTSILLQGQSDMLLDAATGRFFFKNSTSAATVAELTSTGFVSYGSLEARGNILRFGAGASLSASPSGLSILNDADTDSLSLVAGNSLGDGGLLINGGGHMFLYSGSGDFHFIDGAPDPMDPSIGIASLTRDGNLSVSGDLVTLGDHLHFGAGAAVLADPTFLQIEAGDADTDSLRLWAGNDQSDGSVNIAGDGAMTLRSGNGIFNVQHGAGGGALATVNVTGTLNATQDVTATQDVLATRDVKATRNLVAEGDVIAQGYEVHLGAVGSTRIVRNPVTDDFYIARDEDQNNTASTFSIFTNIGIQQMRIGDGDEADALFDDQVVTNGIDYAEAFWITDPSLAAGEVVMFDPERPGFIARAAEPYSNRLAGVISTRPGFLTGGSFEAEEAADPALASQMKAAYAVKDYAAAKEISLVLEQKKKEQQRPVALVGRLPVKVDASYGPIAAGDHLTSSPTPGHAMAMRQAGPSIGVALEDFRGDGTGTILTFVQRGHYTPSELIEATRTAQAQLADTVAARTPDPATGVQVMPANLQVVLDAAGAEAARFSVFRDGQEGEPRAEVFRVDERGDVWAQGAFRPRSMDVAEAFRLSEPVEPGDVLVADREHPGLYARSRAAADAAVVGVVASDPGVILGGDMSRLLNESPDLVETLAGARRRNDRAEERRVWEEVERRFRASHASVALTGTVLVKVDTSFGAIRTGDLLVASPTPGHAMRAPAPSPEGTVLGKALEPLDHGTGAVRMLVMLR